MRIVPIRLSLSNVYLVVDERPILVDAGGPKDGKQITAALAKEGVQLTDLALIVLTHGHADHAGAARDLHEWSGAPVVLHAADAHMAAAGHNDPLHPVGLEAWMVLPFVNFPFPPFMPDIVVERPLDLRSFGVEGTLLPWA
ncbi:MAG: MBL fold metallo-hydrolase, partial [Ktedonobacterales bacterium]|nr:MBL fold metallo-hydrolase [Ktedonobacterales bacterium]